LNSSDEFSLLSGCLLIFFGVFLAGFFLPLLKSAEASSESPFYQGNKKIKNML